MLAGGLHDYTCSDTGAALGHDAPRDAVARRRRSHLLDDTAGEYYGSPVLFEVMTDWFSILEACGENLGALRLPAFYGQEGQPKVAVPWFECIVTGRLRRPAAGSTAAAGSAAPAGSAAASGTAAASGSAAGREPSAGRQPQRPLHGPRAGSAARVGRKTVYVDVRVDDEGPSIRGQVDKDLRAKQLESFQTGYHLHISTTGLGTERGASQATGMAQVEWKTWVRAMPDPDFLERPPRYPDLVWESIRPIVGLVARSRRTSSSTTW